jgi:ribonuclease Z
MTLKTRLAIGLAALLIVGAVGAKLFQAEIGAALLAQVAKQRVGRDATAGLPDGLHVILCGSGSPLPDPTRAGPCTLVIAGQRMFVVDAGEGGARNLTVMGIPTGRIERLLLTHFHSDHIDGMGPLLLLRWSGKPNSTPLPVSGPTGVERVVDGFNLAYAQDNGYRTAHHGPALMPPGGAGAVAAPFAIDGAPVVVLNDGGLKVTAFQVDHDPVDPAVGYRFDYKGRSVVISGDTGPSPSLNTAARGTDLLVHEALQPRLVARLTDALAARNINNTAQITRDILNYHSSPEQAADAARAAGAKQLLLTHIVPPLPLRFAYPAFLGDAADHFDGPITIGEDGMIFSLPASSAAITKDKLP